MTESVRQVVPSSASSFSGVLFSSSDSGATFDNSTATNPPTNDIFSHVDMQLTTGSKAIPDNKPVTSPSKSAAELFTDLSVQLTESYSLLEEQVADLTSELNTVSEQRIQELKDKEQVANRLEQLINFLPGGVVVLDQRGIVVEINPTAEEMLERHLKGRLWRDVISQCFSPKSDDGHEVSNNKGKRINIATRSLGVDGQIILLTDQTETRHLQAQLSRHERLTALGKMVSTLAHQVRTPLSAAMLYANHILDESLPVHKRQDFTQKIVNRLHEMERQVRDMLLFVKAGMPLDDRLTIGELQSQLVESTEMLFTHHSVKCRWLTENSEKNITCNKDALIGAVLNLINNSVQAMEDVKDKGIEKNAELCIALYQQHTDQLVINVVDNGVGIDDVAKPHVNELFFTTKSQGTGIGLSVVNTVVKAHNSGTFSLKNNLSSGASAVLTLPILLSD
ncbi:MAG: two-component system sensor histidine kinase FlrB [Candidatus Endobugula sp.]|jgi:two-component system sensor histidine kinase FlrB